MRVPIGPPKESYSRLKAGFRFIIGIPVMLINYALGVVANVAAFISWFLIVVTGKQNEGLHNAIKLGMAYHGALDRLPLPAHRGLAAVQRRGRLRARAGRRTRARCRLVATPAAGADRDAAPGRQTGVIGLRLAGHSRGLGGQREAPDDLAAQVLGLDDGVDDELGGEVQDVDVLGVLAAQLLGALRALARARPRSPGAG